MRTLRPWFDGCAAYWAGFYEGFIARIGLSSEDGHLSFSKMFGILVLVSYFVRPGNLPAGVAIALIVASFGQKTMMAWIDKGSVTVADEDKSALNITHSDTKTETTTQNIDERRGWNAEREFQES
jgi:hypothetical protein